MAMFDIDNNHGACIIAEMHTRMETVTFTIKTYDMLLHHRKICKKHILEIEHNNSIEINIIT